MSEHSTAITRKSGSSFTPAFMLLPKPRRVAMSVLYAFCREVDDVADDESAPVEKRRAALAAWREEIARACDGKSPNFPVARELVPVIAQYRLPFAYFDDLIRGVEMDLEIKRYESYETLEQYCYRVASVVGLLSIEIFGYQDAACRDYAIYLGKALQLTNILRDVRTDAERGRIYLPKSELEHFKVTPDEILRFQYSARFEALAENVAREAKKYYSLARQTLPAADRRSMGAAELMGSVYWRLLKKLERQRFNVFGPTPTRLSKGHKILLIFRTWYRLIFTPTAPNYGNA
jgi:15-cis-phytoene synthase